MIPPTHFNILDGHPVPYSLTITDADGEMTEEQIRDAGTRWLRSNKPEMQVTRIEGYYVFYDRRTDTRRQITLETIRRASQGRVINLTRLSEALGLERTVLANRLRRGSPEMTDRERQQIRELFRLLGLRFIDDEPT